MKLDPDAIVLVCAPACAPLTTRGSVFNRVCAECGERLMVAPSSQEILREHPGAVTLCALCAALSHGIDIPELAELDAEHRERLERDGKAIPNFWSKRN